MADYEDDDLDEVDDNEQPGEGEGAAAAAAGASNRNFLLALGILGGVFVLLIIGLAILFFSRRQNTPPATGNVEATNIAIMTANAQTAIAATQTVGFLLTPSATLAPTNTAVLPTATNTQVLALGTATSTQLAEQAQVNMTATQSMIGTQVALGTPTSVIATLAAQAGPTATQLPGNLQTRTATIAAVLTLSSGQQTQTAVARLNTTATKLPSTGFAEDVGLPGLFILSVGLLVVIVLARRLRLSPGR